MPKEFLKMADVFAGDIEEGQIAGWAYQGKYVPLKTIQQYAAHAINSHDELVRQRDELLDAMSQTLAMLRVTSHGPSAANKAEDMLHAAICSLGTSHSPDSGKMVPDGWQWVPIEATREMIDAAILVEEDGYAAMHSAMLAAAPKLGDE